MRKKDVRIGKHYLAKVSGKVAVVHLLGEHTLGGWRAVNIKTNRQVHIRTARRLRCEVVSVLGTWLRQDKSGLASLYRSIYGAHKKKLAGDLAADHIR